MIHGSMSFDNMTHMAVYYMAGYHLAVYHIEVYHIAVYHMAVYHMRAWHMEVWLHRWQYKTDGAITYDSMPHGSMIW